MQLTLIAAAATLFASATATTSQYDLSYTYEEGQPYAKVVNRCDYDVNIWSIEKQQGTPKGAGKTLKKGDFYHEKLRNSTSWDNGGISIKISKYDQCGGKDHTQLEYKLNWVPGYVGDYVDMSFVDCAGEDCPGRKDGFYMKVGDQEQEMQTSAVNNEHCPVFNVYNAEQAAAVSYINPNDRQTKFCTCEASVELYLCGGHAPGSDDESEAPASSSEKSKPTPAKTYAAEKPSITAVSDVKAKVPVVEAAAADVTTKAPATPIIKTEIVYETIMVKRHEHGRRHQHFHS